MTNVRRYYIPNAPVFITAVCYQRKPFLENDVNKELLLSVMRDVKSSKPFSMIAYVLLDDHFHWIIKTCRSGCDQRELPDKTENVRERFAHPDLQSGIVHFSQIMQSVKLRFVHRFKRVRGIETSISLWQRRFWDHVIRGQKDLSRHLDYIHYNPVKHGYVASPFEYEWSSFKTLVKRGKAITRRSGCPQGLPDKKRQMSVL
jgi:putative transposase